MSFGKRRQGLNYRLSVSKLEKQGKIGAKRGSKGCVLQAHLICRLSLKSRQSLISIKSLRKSFFQGALVIKGVNLHLISLLSA